MRRALNLNIAPGAERHAFSGRNGKLQLFNKRGFVIVRDNLTFPLLHAEHFVRQFDFHILTHGNLTGQTAALFGFALGNMRKLGRQNIAAALFHLHPALATGTTATAGR